MTDEAREIAAEIIEVASLQFAEDIRAALDHYSTCPRKYGSRERMMEERNPNVLALAAALGREVNQAKDARKAHT